MSSRRVLKKSAANAKQGGPIKTEDARITLVADWLRNEKRSGLKTKEAVQYEKVRPVSRPLFSASPRTNLLPAIVCSALSTSRAQSWWTR